MNPTSVSRRNFLKTAALALPVSAGLPAAAPDQKHLFAGQCRSIVVALVIYCDMNQY